MKTAETVRNDGSEWPGVLIRVTGVATLFQLAMVVTGHWVVTLANLYALLGTLIALLAGFVYGALAGRGYLNAIAGGAVAGGACALVGTAVSYLLGDVEGWVVTFATGISAVAALFGGLFGHLAVGRRRGPDEVAGPGRAEEPAGEPSRGE